MAFSAMVRTLLISAPSDVPDDDWRVVVDSVLRWNKLYGEKFGACVTPVRWKDHAGAVHGSHPQDSINTQLVEDADAVLALFWHRVGTATPGAVSGTVEEMELALEKGKTVGALRCTRPYPRDVDTTQLERLNEYFKSNRDRSLVLEYDDERTLSQHVDTFLTRLVTVDQVASIVAVSAPTPRADVWARVDTEDVVKQDSKGRIKNDRRWSLVLYNSGEAPARNVSYRLEKERDDIDGEVPMIIDNEATLEVLAPKGESRWRLLLHFGVVDQVRCVISWSDDDGEHENVVTLRLI